MIRAVLFDMGGTLDGDGLHWLDRFVELYASSPSAGAALPRETLRAAFDEAEMRASSDEAIAALPLERMIARHVDWQLEQLNRSADSALRRHLVDGFVAPVRAAAADNVRLLSDLSDRGFRLGVVSNGCGNVDVLCGDLGYTPYLSVIVDSRRVRLFKPDPAIFVYAAAKLAMPASDILMVGDSFDRDIRPAKSIGMATAWLEGPRTRTMLEPALAALADVRLRRLAELPSMLEMRASA